MPYKKMEFREPTEREKNLIFLINIKRYLREKKLYYENLKKNRIFEEIMQDAQFIRGKIETYEEILDKLDLFTLEDKMRKMV